MTDTKPSRDYLAVLLGAASDAVSSASGDHGIDARDNNARVLHDCIERQQKAIEHLARMVVELLVAMETEQEAEEARRESDEEVASMLDDHRRAKERMAAWPRPEGWTE